jgi:outer membrane biosynthesis protein TonB
MPLRLASIILIALTSLPGCQTARVPKGTAVVTAAATAPGEAAAYRAHVLGSVASKWREYAEKYRTKLQTGRAIAEFALDEYGAVRAVRFVEPPAHSLFRKACEYSIRNSQFDPPPAALLKDGLHTDAFTFTLQ